ncbi:hypothetical protein D3C75_506090 [compost metagenome]
MIEWIKYDPENPPTEGRYLAWNGLHLPEICIFDSDCEGEPAEWFDVMGGPFNPPVTHYAHINLPGEETDNA